MRTAVVADIKTAVVRQGQFCVIDPAQKIQIVRGHVCTGIKIQFVAGSKTVLAFIEPGLPAHGQHVFASVQPGISTETGNFVRSSINNVVFFCVAV